jgi:response regulator NasT
MRTRVLIAEDNWLTPTVLRAELEAHGYEVVGVAKTGTEAVDFTRAEAPEVVLMDIQMPEVDGIQATRAIMEERPTCVVIVTGHSELSQVAQQAGAMAYLVKPFMPDEIVEVVDQARRRYQWFELVLGESPDAYEALRVWSLLQQAVRVMANRDKVPEEQAFAGLRQRAADRGTSLHRIARTIVPTTEAPASS